MDCSCHVKAVISIEGWQGRGVAERSEKDTQFGQEEGRGVRAPARWALLQHCSGTINLPVSYSNRGWVYSTRLSVHPPDISLPRLLWAATAFTAFLLSTAPLGTARVAQLLSPCVPTAPH